MLRKTRIGKNLFFSNPLELTFTLKKLHHWETIHFTTARPFHREGNVSLPTKKLAIVKK